MIGRVQVLDHGYLEPIESWGSDERVIESARMSTGKGFLGWGPTSCLECGGAPFASSRDCEECVGQGGRYDEVAQDQWYDCRACEALRCKKCSGKGTVSGDEKLLRFLYEHHHNTPFEMAGLTIETQAPIFVFREWHRHRVPFGYNEMSARYTPLPDVNYIPTVERLMVGSDGKNRQAGTIAGAAVLCVEDAEEFQERLRGAYADAESTYQWALKAGIPKELARIHLPVGRYSRMRATANLRGWLGFIALRAAPGAQYEIRVYANAVGDIIKERFPRTWELFSGGRGA